MAFTGNYMGWQHSDTHRPDLLGNNGVHGLC